MVFLLRNVAFRRNAAFLIRSQRIIPLRVSRAAPVMSLTVPSFGEANPIYFANKLKMRLSTYSNIRLGNGPWEYGYNLVNDISNYYAQRGYKHDEERGLMDVLITYVKNLHQDSGNGRKMTVPELASFLEDLLTLEHETIATPEILTVSRQEALKKIGAFFEEKEPVSLHISIAWNIEEEWLRGCVRILRAFHLFRWDPGLTFLYAVDVVFSLWALEAQADPDQLAELLQLFAAFSYCPSQHFVDAVLRSRDPSQPVLPDKLKQEAQVALAGACLGLEAFAPYVRTVADSLMRQPPDPELHGTACRLVWSLAVFRDLRPEDCKRLLCHTPPQQGRSVQDGFMLRQGVQTLGPQALHLDLTPIQQQALESSKADWLEATSCEAGQRARDRLLPLILHLRQAGFQVPRTCSTLR
eukprot:jgi/Botrbrau1/7650/Bobra.0159s0092.2